MHRVLALACLTALVAPHPLMASQAAAGQAPAAVHHVSHRPHRATRHAHPALAALPPPAATQPVSTPAPVPDEAASAPIDQSKQHTQLAPSVFQLHYPNQGDGYVNGSSPQAMDDNNAARATGVQMSVPLSQ